ncbi:MAG: bifunctional nuclease family protein [Treponema sp.]|jgi:bifunctional DNase/RNase|nr:bifunctional nuclease family protein [Treponema sp.]
MSEAQQTANLYDNEMLKTEIWSVARVDQGNAVLLRPLGSDTVVPIFIGDVEAHAIILGLGEIQAERPLTCDTLLELSRRLGLNLFRVEVYEIRKDTFYARLFFSGCGYSRSRPLVIESRPSDAIALALREKCGVYVTPQVLDRAGVPAEVFIEGVADAMGNDLTGSGLAKSGLAKTGLAGNEIPRETVSEKRSRSPGRKRGNPLVAKRRRLQAELEQALAEEAYERAADIRDLLILLDQQLEQERWKTP